MNEGDEQQELQSSRSSDPLSTLANLADLGMKQMVMAHPEMTFHIGLTALMERMTDEEKGKMATIAKDQGKSGLDKFVAQEELFFSVLDRLGVGFMSKPKTMFEELMEKVEMHRHKEITVAVARYCAENGLKMPSFEDVVVS